MLLAGLVFGNFAKADSPPSALGVNLDVEAPGGTIFNQMVYPADCTPPGASAASLNAFCVFEAAGLTVDSTTTPSGLLITSINSTLGNWQWSLNGGAGQTTGSDAYLLNAGDSITWSLPSLPPIETATVVIRNASSTIFSNSVNLASPGAPDIQVLPSNASSTISVPARSVLGILKTLESSTSAFQITDFAYYPTLGSSIINCVAAPLGNTPDCYNWTYAVNNSYPFEGVDKKIISNGDIIYLFFGSQHKVELSKTSVNTGENFTATAQKYDLATGGYVPLTGVTLGVGTANPYPTPFSELATSTVDSNGQATFSLPNAGTFQVGISEDWYFPSVDVVAVSPGNNGSGGVTHSNLSIPSAMSFITLAQKPDGSFSSPLETDWAALAFGTQGSSPAKEKLKAYLQTAKPALSSTTDYERHSMALMALGLNPYNVSGTDYISPIINSFDGTQIGTPDDADDIFGLIVFEHTGFTSADSIIKKTAAYVLSKQQANGSWDNNPDMTAAAIQAIGPLFDIPGANQAMGGSVGYLKSTQVSNAGWGNIDSTSWVQTAINGIIEANTPGLQSESFWASAGGLFPTDAIASAQQADGGVQSTNRLWSTSYAVVAASNMSWISILQPVSKPVPNQTPGGSSAVTAPVSSSTPSTTLPSLLNSTSTPATTTPILITEPEISLATETPALIPTSTQPKIIKLKIKPKAKISSGAVLGASVQNTSPVLPPETQVQQPKPEPGFWHRVWNSITGFVSWIF